MLRPQSVAYRVRSSVWNTVRRIPDTAKLKLFGRQCPYEYRNLPRDICVTSPAPQASSTKCPIRVTEMLSPCSLKEAFISVQKRHAMEWHLRGQIHSKIKMKASWLRWYLFCRWSLCEDQWKLRLTVGSCWSIFPWEKYAPGVNSGVILCRRCKVNAVKCFGRTVYKQ